MHGGMLVAESWFVSSWLRNPLSRRDDNREGRRREGRKEGRRKAWGVEEGLLKRPDPNPVALLAFTWPRRKLCGTRHDDGAKNRWWPTEREKAGPVPAAASHLDSVAGVFGHLRLAACHDSLRLVYSIVTLLSSFLSFLLSSFFSFALPALSLSPTFLQRLLSLPFPPLRDARVEEERKNTEEGNSRILKFAGYRFVRRLKFHSGIPIVATRRDEDR